MKASQADESKLRISDGDILIVKSNPGSIGSEDIVVAEENGREILKQAKDAIVNGTMPDATQFKGVVVNGKGYGAATVKKAGAVAVKLE